MRVTHLVKQTFQPFRHRIEEYLIKRHCLRRLPEKLCGGIDAVAQLTSGDLFIILKKKVVDIELKGDLRAFRHVRGKYPVSYRLGIAFMYVFIIRKHLSCLIVYDPGLSRSKTVNPVDKALQPLSGKLSENGFLTAQYLE